MKTVRLTNTTQGQTNQQKAFKYDTSSEDAKTQVAILFDNLKQSTANELHYFAEKPVIQINNNKSTYQFSKQSLQN